MRWLEDSYSFNEWMNEIDYEMDEPVETEVRKSGRSLLSSLHSPHRSYHSSLVRTARPTTQTSTGSIIVPENDLLMTGC